MANEISATVSLSASKGGAAIGLSSTLSLTMAGAQMVQHMQNIGTVAEALVLGDIAGVPGLLYIKNLDSVNYVELATDSGMVNKFAKLLAGLPALFPPSSATIYARANTAAVNVMIGATEA